MATAALPPGPGLGRRRELLAWIARPEWLMEEARRRCGDVFTLHVPAGPTVFIADPAVIREVFADADVFRAGEASTGFEPILGPGSTLMLDGAEHLRRRRLLLPPFHGDRLRGQQQTIVDVTAAEVARWPAGETLKLAPRMRAVTLEVILRMVIGLGDGRRRDEIRERFSRLVPTGPAALLLLPVFQRELGGRSRWGRLMHDLRAIDAILYDEIADRRRAPDLKQRADVLSLLIGARAEDGSALTDRELRDELMSLLLVGHETTATTLAWTFALLFAHPHAYARLRDEVRAGGAALPYLDAVCTEVLRLRPPGPNGRSRKPDRPVRRLGIFGTRLRCFTLIAGQPPARLLDPLRRVVAVQATSASRAAMRWCVRRPASCDSARSTSACRSSGSRRSSISDTS